jgi:2'-5' RNA ligase
LERTLSLVMRKPQSAVVVRFDLPTGLERIRRTFIPVARLGVPAHLTILYPFLEPIALELSVRRRLAAVAARTTAFDVEFTAVEAFPDAFYLAPSPAEPFQQLTAGVVEAFPGNPPYGDPSMALEDLIPHLTLAMRDGSPDRDVQLVAEALLPVRGTVRRLTIIEEGAGGRWQTRWRIRLGLRP